MIGYDNNKDIVITRDGKGTTLLFGRKIDAELAIRSIEDHIKLHGCDKLIDDNFFMFLVTQYLQW